MAKAPSYALFLYQMGMLKKELADSDFEGCDDVLAYMAVKESEGATVKITELVQSLQFGTGPTVQRKVHLLAERGLITMLQSKNDARAKDLSLTAAAVKHLKERSRLLKKCLDS